MGNSDYTTLFGEKMKALSVLYEWQTMIAYSIESSVNSSPEPRDLKCFELALMEDSYEEDFWNSELFYPILGYFFSFPSFHFQLASMSNDFIFLTNL